MPPPQSTWQPAQHQSTLQSPPWSAQQQQYQQQQQFQQPQQQGWWQSGRGGRGGGRGQGGRGRGFQRVTDEEGFGVSPKFARTGEEEEFYGLGGGGASSPANAMCMLCTHTRTHTHTAVRATECAAVASALFAWTLPTLLLSCTTAYAMQNMHPKLEGCLCL